jgi:stage II sporulation protein R
MGGLPMNRKNLIIAVSLTFTMIAMIVLQNVQSDAYSMNKQQSSGYVDESIENGRVKQGTEQYSPQGIEQATEKGIRQDLKPDIKSNMELETIQTIKQDAKEETEEQLTNSISKKVIRFHVIANSDSDEDQAIKLKIRDAILMNMGTRLEQLQTKEESTKFLKGKLIEIENIADEILAKDRKTYRSKAYLQEFEFPIKSYGEITLPQGKYTALRVVLGNGDGKNWWCVMFPPLCFIDITRGLASEESNMELGKVLDKKELGKITSKKTKENLKMAKETSSNYKKSNIQVRFKTVDFIKKLLK